MRKISATYIFSLSAPPIPGGVVIVEDDGTIADVLNDAADMEDVEYYEGILCPGFVNAHCHMELSHLKGMVGQGRGLHGFVSDLQGVRELVPFSQAAFHAAERELRSGGVVAVGDVANGNSTFRFKQASGLYYHTFVEVFGLRPGTEAAALGKGLHLLKELDEMGLSASLSPHAPYSLTPELFSLLRATQRRVPLSMHNQECAAENEMFVSRSGALLNTLVSFGIDLDWFHPSGQSSLQSVMQHLDPAHKILLVHNTFTAKDDLQAA
ncbi:MAG: amidohydrolase family protein, partial [Flavobacteriales bacterium]